MKPKELIESLYLGDRSLKRIVIDSWERRIGIQIDCISRLRPGKQTWDYYNDENVDNGWLVFDHCSSICFSPQGYVPDDVVNEINVKDHGDEYIFDLKVGSSVALNRLEEVTIHITAKSVSIRQNQEFVAKLLETG